MSLEACIFCIDNSDWTRNGDYAPNRYDSQIEAANMLAENKTDRNPENSIGVISMAGKRVETPVTLTSDVSIILKSFKEIKIHGECDFVTACNISLLVLKNRQNKVQKQRILMFVASPIKNKIDEMVLLGKKLKKNNVAIDVISLGNVDANRDLVEALITNANNSNNSHFLEVSPEQYLMDSLFTSPILLGEISNNDIPMNDSQNPRPIDQHSGNNVNPNSGGLSQFEKDINLAIQQSIEEEEKRKKGDNKDEVKKEENKPINTNIMDIEEEEDIEAELEKARLLSITEHEETLKKEKEKEKAMKEHLIDNDENFMKDLLNEVGLDPNNDEEIRKAVKEDNKKEDNKKDDTNKDNDCDDEKDKFIKK